MNDETIVIDDSSSLTVEELEKTLEKYFYSKEETSLNSQESSNETIIEQVQIMNDRIEYQNTLLYLTCVVSFAILLLVLYYRFLKNFIERWF